MNFWSAAVCLAALSVSLLLILRRKTSATRRFGAALLQVVIWGLAWALVNPPLLLPAKSTEPSVELPQTRDALRDLPPVRLPTETAGEPPSWQPDWPRQLVLGETLQLRITHDTGIAGRVSLESPFGHVVDSANLSADGGETRLSDTPKLTGRHLYQLRIETQTDNGTTVRREPLPVQVFAPESPKVMLWLARPGFETAALSRWLRQSGTPARVVTQLAPNVVRRESFNGLETELQPLLDTDTPFDLLILDSRLWPQLSEEQRQVLPVLAEQRSLLWLVRPDSAPGFLDYARAQGMPLFPAELIETGNLPATPEKILPLTSTGYRPQQTNPGDIQLGNPAIYWGRSNGEQSLGFVLFDRSYRWITASFTADYSRLWKTLFDHQLRHRGARAPVQLQTQLPREHKRITLCSAAFSNRPPKLFRVNNRESDTPLEGIALPDRTCYSWWPEQSGWHRVGSDRDGHHFYVFPHDAWPQWQQTLVRTETQQMASARLGPPTDKEIQSAPLPRNWLALTLILLLAFSWWRERSSLR